MAQEIIAFAALVEDPDSVASTYRMFHDHLNSSSRGSDALSWPSRCARNEHTHMQAKQLYQ